MEAIPAANHLNIEFEANSWRLVSRELDNPTTLVEATPEGLVTHPVFRAARSLSGATLSPAQIVRVMLGWAPENQAWRLGMLLIENSHNISTLDTTQLQWCELATWPDTNNVDQIDNAKLAGQALARLLNRPFQFVEPHGKTRVAVFTSSEDDEIEEEPDTLSDDGHHVAPDIELQSLPIEFSDWFLTRVATGIQWRRNRGWWWINIGRMVLFGLLSILFFVLSIGSMTRGLAEVEPNSLPQIGLAIGALMIGILLFSIWQLLNTTTVIIDTMQREVYCQSIVLSFIHWRIPFDSIEYLLITQSPPRAQGRRQRSDPMQIAQEVWLHLYDGEDFYEVGDLDEVEGRSWAWEVVRTHNHSQVRRGLQLAHYDTPAHHAAQQIAHLLDVPVYIDLM